MMSEPSSSSDDTSRAPVVILVTVILIGAGAWVAVAFLSGGGPAPERAEAFAEEGERECILDGVAPGRCPEIVGRHHRSCLQEAMDAPPSSETQELSRDAYMSCLRTHFPDSDGDVERGE